MWVGGSPPPLLETGLRDSRKHKTNTHTHKGKVKGVYRRAALRACICAASFDEKAFAGLRLLVVKVGLRELVELVRRKKALEKPDLASDTFLVHT